MSKKVVHYIGTPVLQGIGRAALLTPVDHPDSENVTNKRPVRTSKVVNFGHLSGFIETENTMYMPLHPLKDGFPENAK